VVAKAEREKALQARVAELEAGLARSERTVQALREVGLALGSTLDLDQLLELILKQITDLLQADRATLYLLDEQRGRLLSRIIIGEEARSIELPLGEGIAGHVAKVGRTLRIKDAYRDRRFRREWDDATGYRTRSILAAPMKNHVGRTIGVIQVLNKHGEGTEFSQHDEELLEALATQAAISIDNSRLFLSVIQKNMQLVETKEQLERRVADLKLLFELERAMGRAATLEDLARAVIVEAARACQAAAGGIAVDEGEAGVWLYFVDIGRPSLPPASPFASVDAPLLTGGRCDDVGPSSRPPGPLADAMRDTVPPLVAELYPEVRRVAVKRGEGIIGWSMVHNEAVCVPRGHEIVRDGEGPVSARLGQLLDISVASAIAVPLEGEDGEAAGAMALYNSAGAHGFSQDDRALLRLVSANASTAVRLFRSRAEREKSERLASIGSVVSGIIHDLRTPLAVISGNAQLMAGASEPATRTEYLKAALKQFDVIDGMQREVLAFARGESGILPRRVHLSRFFDDLAQQIQHELEGTGVALVMQIEDRGVARFDEAKMTRAVHNLVRNALEAMEPDGGTLTIRVAREDGEVVITVADTGKGIPKEVEGRLFQSFVTAGKRGRGTGLGLAIVKKIVDEHGGAITAASSPRGATFTVRIPPEPPPAAKSPPRELAAGATARPERRGRPSPAGGA
jgi:signal transduction histidine kinase/putative methionine-R-sulfoxide reductase with GAF domain